MIVSRKRQKKCLCFSCGFLPSLYFNLFFNKKAIEYLEISSFPEMKQTSSKLKILTVSSNICKYTLKKNILTPRLSDNLSHSGRETITSRVIYWENNTFTAVKYSTGCWKSYLAFLQTK